MKLPKTYFGWGNFKWLVGEISKMYSGKEESYFSKKRVESGIAFVILQWGMVKYFLAHIPMDMTSMLMWAAAEGVICGYMIGQIEKNNRLSTPTVNTNTSETKVTDTSIKTTETNEQVN